MRIYANAEMAVIARGWQRFKAQGELMRVVGARIEDGGNANGGNIQRRPVGGRGMSILPHHRFNPGVSLAQVCFLLYPCR